MGRLNLRRSFGKERSRKPGAISGDADQDLGPAPEAVQEELQRLRRALEELTFLNELAREISISHNSKEVIEKVVRRSLEAVSAEQGVITLVEEEAAKTVKKGTIERVIMSPRELAKYHCNQKMLDWMQEHKRPLVINDPYGDQRFADVKWDEDVTSVLCAPLLIKSKLTGILSVYNKKEGKHFSEDDERFLGIIASHSAMVIESARLYEEEEKLRFMQEELKVASRIQEDLLPKESPKITGYEAAGKSIPARMVGGDYFDFIRIDDNSWAFALGDVSGKGLPASLLMANLGATLRAQAMLSDSPRECLHRSNRLLFHCTNVETFATVFYGMLDTKEHQFRFSSAGHEIPFLFSKEPEPNRPRVNGLALGILEEFPFEEDSVHIDEGDLLLIYSDGVVDAENASGEHFGEEKLKEVIEKHLNESPSKLIEQIIAAVESHAGGVQQIDDVTMVVLRRTGA
ncbi:MAG: SpoIIE family protein phosphatase [Candidatus Latescibacteria bacterium]|nr:SpoIIE family protein phosphatase [Candidatus Latescibacterota bacterium]NIO28393.1 SpoIIE family protein phosphatase [Candidatus Latescibacterota bacterium]NIO55942.1 SpoIIE family protein phosphatase [Candidatus Latescibacterota bacterium]NIT01906.1 SpoIIE family protein phosphatase [Candidatus Latescibacterota bacterium]